MNMIIIHNYYNTIGDTDKNSSRKNALLENIRIDPQTMYDR